MNACWANLKSFHLDFGGQGLFIGAVVSFAWLLCHGLHDRSAVEPLVWVYVHALVLPDMQWSTLPRPTVYSQHVFMILVQFVYSCQIGFLLRVCLVAQQYEIVFLSCGQFYFFAHKNGEQVSFNCISAIMLEKMLTPKEHNKFSLCCLPKVSIAIIQA